MIALFCVDGVTTYFGLKLGGREANSVVRIIIATIGLVPALIATRALVFYAVGQVDARAMVFIAIVLAVIQLNNLACINKLRRKAR